MLELKDKLNLLWKFLFLAVFTYGVISVTCCKKSCSSSCKQNTTIQKQCGPNCVKSCCATKTTN